MEITVDRKWKKDGYTISRLFIDGQRLCECLEDTDRGLRQDMPLEEIKKKKVYGETAIPTGRYAVIMSYSPKFRKTLPEVLDVPGYGGIRIHSGNTPKDTLGCLLPGRNLEKGKVLHSAMYTKMVISRIEAATKKGEEVWLNVGGKP